MRFGKRKKLHTGVRKPIVGRAGQHSSLAEADDKMRHLKIVSESYTLRVTVARYHCIAVFLHRVTFADNRGCQNLNEKSRFFSLVPQPTSSASPSIYQHSTFVNPSRDPQIDI